MRKLLSILYVICTVAGVSWLAAPLAEAHVLEENNGTAVVMHVAPDDNPIAGKLTTIEFDFSSTRGAFNLQHCRCVVTLAQNGHQLTRTTITPSKQSTQVATIQLTFPEVGIYNLTVQGDTSQPFRVVYTVRVASSVYSTPNTGAGTQVALISGASLLILIIIAHRQISRGDRYK